MAVECGGGGALWPAGRRRGRGEEAGTGGASETAGRR